MGQSSGAGSPVWFRCPRSRSRLLPDDTRHWTEHVVELTGRTRPYRPSRGSALGARSRLVSREYRCSCGHVGWSNHADLAQRAAKEAADAA